MGLWSGMPFQNLERFIGSLRHTSFEGDVCVLVDDIGLETIEAMLAHGILVERADRITASGMHGQSSRYFGYLDFLVRHRERYANVMISDLRDVVFQCDPFAQPLPADIVFAQERCRIGDSPINHNWIAAVYGEAVAQNLRDCMISCSGTTFGTTGGMLRYLFAMTTELANLAGHDALRTRGIDQGIHNYLIRMRPFSNAQFDTSDRLAATLGLVPDAAITCTPDALLVDGRRTPVLHQYDRNSRALDYVAGAPQFRLDGARPVKGRNPQREAVIAFYHRPRDADWLKPCLQSLRSTGYVGQIHCLGSFTEQEMAVLSHYDSFAHRIMPPDPALDVETVAHLFVNRILDRVSADLVLVLDTMCASFRDSPFRVIPPGLSLFQDGTKRIGDSASDRYRVAQFAPADAAMLRRAVVSSSLLRGRLDVVRAFYRRLLGEFIGHAELLRGSKMVQGAFNKLYYCGEIAPPAVLHPNGAAAFVPSQDAEFPVGQAQPFVILYPTLHPEVTRTMLAEVVA